MLPPASHLTSRTESVVFTSRVGPTSSKHYPLACPQHPWSTVVAREVKLVTLQKGIRIHQYLDEWMVRARSHQTCLQHAQTLVALCRELGWLVNKKKSELDPKQVFNFVGYQFDLKEGKVRPTDSGTLAGLNNQDSSNTVRSSVPSLTVHVPHRSTYSNRQTRPPRSAPDDPHTNALEEQLEGTRVTRKVIPIPRMVTGGKQCASRSTITPTKTCFADIYRDIKRRVGHSLKRVHCKENLVHSRKQGTHQLSGTKGSLSGPK